MGMSSELAPEQEKLREEAREFAQKIIAPIVSEIDEKDDTSLVLYIWKKMAEPPYRYTGMFIPKEYGGYPRSVLEGCIVAEEVAFGSKAAIGTALIEASGLGTTALTIGGNEEQKRKYLPPVARGEGVPCFALTEPGAGSDAAAIGSTAERVGDEYILRGRKRYASFAHICEFAVVFAKTDPEKGPRGISAFLVPKGTPGFIVVEKIPCIGMRGHQDEEVELRGLRIPKENLIGEEGRGLRYGLATLDKTRTNLSAGFVGLARAAFEEACKFAKGRKTFGKRIYEYQAVGFPLADLWTEIEAARLLVYKAAGLADRGMPHTGETASAKAFASQVLIKATNLAVEVHGGFGGTKRFPVERMLRDGRIWVFAQGAPNILRLIVWRHLFEKE